MADPILLFQLSDIHFGVENREALAWVREEIARQRPDAIAITGDLTMRAKHSEFAAAREWIGALDTPVTIEVGNHDLPYYNMIERLLTPYRRFGVLESAVESELDFPDLSLVPLLTTPRVQARWPWSDGVVKDSALAETLTAIDALPQGRNVIVTAHHPLKQEGKDGRQLTIGGEKALEELAKRKVLAVISGHVHDAFDLVHDTKNGPVRMIGAGTLSTRLRSTPPSFNELRWDGRELTVRARNYVGMTTAEMQVEDVPEGKLPGE